MTRRVVLLGVVIVLGGLYLARERIWALAGPADLGPVAFETLQRRTTPNDALACPPSLCTASSDIAPPDFAVPAATLRTAFAHVIAGEPRVMQVASDDATLTDRYVQRSAVMSFPDTIVVRFIDRAAGRSTMAMYSRSQLGESDLGVNRARLGRWLAALARAVPPMGA